LDVYPRGYFGPRRTQRGEDVGCDVVVPIDVMELKALELVFELANCGTVLAHVICSVVLIFVELADGEHGIAIDHEALDAERYGHVEAMEHGFILRCVIGCLEEDLHHIFELLATWVDEEDSCSRSV
jgi:hypothetical protein